MENVIGLIGDIDGVFYALSNTGEKREIQSGDELYAGESVVGSESNVESDSVIVTLLSDDSPIVIVGNSTESFSNLTTPEIQVAQVEDSKVEVIASILGETENMDEIDTAAGEGGSGPESSEGGEANFAVSNNASVDVEASNSVEGSTIFQSEEVSIGKDEDKDHELARLINNTGTTTVISADGTITVTDINGTVTVTNPDGTTTVTQTDSNGNIIVTVTDPDGTVTVAVTTPTGETTTTVTQTDSNGNIVVTVTDPDGTVTVAVTTPTGETTTTVTDPEGVITITNPDGSVTVIEPITAISDSNTGTGDTQNLTNDNTPTISGVTKPNSEVVITDAEGNVIGTTTSDADGNYSIEVDQLLDGENVLTITVTDPDGNVYTDTITINVDTGINSNTDDAITVEIDSATSTGDVTNLTNDNTPTITGNTEPNSLVEIYDGVTLIGSGMSDENGDYSITVSDENALSDGEHTLTIKVTDEAGNVLSDTITINVDTVIDSGVGEDAITADLSDATNSGLSDDNITNNNTPEITGNTEANVDIVITTADGVVVGEGTSDDNGDYTITLSELDEGNNDLIVSVTDEAGNDEALNISVVVDTQVNASDATITLDVVSEDGYINSTEVNEVLTITGTSTAAENSEIILEINGGEFTTTTVKVNGTFSIEIPASTMAGYTDGTYTLTASVVADAAGNMVSDSKEVILDTSASDNNGDGTGTNDSDAIISLNQISGNFINATESTSAGVEITGTSTAVGSIVSIMVGTNLFGTTTVQADGTFSLPIATDTFDDFTDGTYVVTATVDADKAGNTVSSSQSVVLDRVLGDIDSSNGGELVTIDTISADTGAADFTTSQTKQIISGTFDNESDNHLVITVDGEQKNIIINGNNWSVNLTTEPLSEGAHVVVATIADSAGNTSSTTQIITIDTTPAAANAIVLDDISGGYLNALEDTQDLVISGSVGSGSVDGASVTINFNGHDYITTVLDGRFSTVVPTNTLVDGTTYTATASTAISNATVTSTQELIVDKTFEVVGNNDNYVTFDSISDDGTPDTDFITNDNTILMSGTFDNVNSNSLVITVNGVLFTPSIVENNWTLDYRDTPYPDGSYEVVATLTDLAGNTVTKTQNVVIDTSATDAGDATIILDEISGNYINANEAANESIFITGSTTNAVGESVTIKVNGADFTSTIVSADGTFSVEITAGIFTRYTDGTYTVSAEVVADTAGNIVSDSEDVILDRDSGDTGNGDGTGTGGADATIGLNEISDDYINLAESGLPVEVTGTTTAVAGTAIVVNFNGVDYSTVTLSNGTFRVNVDASSVIDGTTLNVTASVVADAAENLAFANEDVMIDLSAGIINNSITTVFESALETGSNPSESGRTLNGNLLEGSSQIDDSTLSSISINGVEGRVSDESPDVLILDTPRGVIYVASTDTVVSGTVYSMGDFIYTLDSAGSDAMENIVYTMSDVAGNTSSATLNINIVDDSPVVSEVSIDKYINADTDHTNVTNLVLTIDVSGSMAWDANGYEDVWWNNNFDPSTVRLDLAQAALENLINEYSAKGDVNIQVISFSNGATYGENSQFMNDPQAAVNYINNLQAVGGTNYDAAMDASQSFSAEQFPDSDDNFYYFISDGEPNSSYVFEGNNEVGQWNDYANSHYDKVFAIGIGTHSDSLSNIGGNNTIYIDDATDLDAALLSTIATVEGNLTSYDINGSVINLGADGGKIDSVEIDGTTYGYAEYNNQSITTELGGEFKIDFDDGSYAYKVGIDNPNNTDSEILTVNATSSDGESATGTLTLHLQENADQSYLYKEGVSVDTADGYDTLVINDSIDIGEFNMNITNVNAIDMGKGESNAKDLGLTLEDILGITEADHTLHISGDEFDHIDLGNDSNWELVTGTETGYDKYVHSVDTTVTLQIEDKIIVDHI